MLRAQERAVSEAKMRAEAAPTVALMSAVPPGRALERSLGTFVFADGQKANVAVRLHPHVEAGAVHNPRLRIEVYANGQRLVADGQPAGYGRVDYGGGLPFPNPNQRSPLSPKHYEHPQLRVSFYLRPTPEGTQIGSFRLERVDLNSGRRDVGDLVHSPEVSGWVDVAA